MVGTGIEWYELDRKFVTMAETRQSILLSIAAEVPVGIHFVVDVAQIGSFIIADWLMVCHDLLLLKRINVNQAFGGI